VFGILATDRQRHRQTDQQMDITDALSRSCCHERCLNSSTSNSTVGKRPRVLRVIEYFAKSLKVIRNDTFE